MDTTSIKTLLLTFFLLGWPGVNIVVAQSEVSNTATEEGRPVTEDTSSAAETKELTAKNKAQARQKAKERDVSKLLEEFDANEDGMLDVAELPEALNAHLKSLDLDQDGQFTLKELLKMRGRPGSKAGEIITGAAKDERYDDTLKVGDPAPDFKLADPSGQRQVTLSSFQGKRPVVLIFGSYT